MRQLARSRGEQFDLDLLPVDDTRRLIKEVKSNGATLREIAKLTGLQARQIVSIEHEQTRIRRGTARRIARALAETDVRAIDDKTLVPITNERDLIQRLTAQGWSHPHLRHILENNGKGQGAIIDSLTRKKTQRSKWGNLKQVHWLVEVIGDKQGPSPRAAEQMRLRGIFPLKHYTKDGKLNERTLTDEQRQWVR